MQHIVSVAKILWNNLFQSHKQYQSKDEGIWCPSREQPNFLGKATSTRFKVSRLRRDTQSVNYCTL